VTSRSVKHAAPAVPLGLQFSSEGFERLTHYLFRYPAKFHPPIVRSLIAKYTSPGDTILDPFVGSGTLLVEALVAGRAAVGLDVDPIAVAISAVKSHRYRPSLLRATAEQIVQKIAKHERSAIEYKRRMFVDLSNSRFNEAQKKLTNFIPNIPKIEHWFRRYVIVDLAQIAKVIHACEMTDSHREFFETVFASIIRNSSNADPVPVSGLEVTSHMIRLDEEGRLINPFAQFRKALESALTSIENFYAATDGAQHTRVYQGDATEVAKILKGSRRATAQGISCWTIEQLARVVEAAERRHINARKLQDIVLRAFTPLAVTAEVERLLSQPTFDKVDLYNAVLDALGSLENPLKKTPRNIFLLGSEISRLERFRDVDTPEIRDAVTDLARASSGMLHISEDDQVFVLGSLDELRRRVSTISGQDTPPRRGGTFRQESPTGREP
jgi:DNA methylase